MRELKEFTYEDIAKYKTIGTVGILELYGIRFTREHAMEIYKGALRDLTEANSIEKSVIEFDKKILNK